MQAVMKKVVYSFWYQAGPGQVGREVFHIVLSQKSIYSKFYIGVIPADTLCTWEMFIYNDL